MINLHETQELLTDPTKKIQAIKLYREQTGKSLKESKEAVEFSQKTGRWDMESKSAANMNKDLIDEEKIAQDRSNIKKYKPHLIKFWNN